MLKRFALPLLVAALFFCSSALLFPRQNSQLPTRVQLPEGSGKSLVEEHCTQCHGLDHLTTSGYTRADWEVLFGSMIYLPPDQSALLSGYLSTNFPARRRPYALLVRGDANISIEEWMAPTLGSQPYDTLATPDGALWWAGMHANVLGWLNPGSGDKKEYPLETPNSGPLGLTTDAAGNIWFTANTAGYVGKLNPQNGDVTEYRMPDAGAKDPFALVFDKQGILWFTLPNSNRLGRLNPENGEIKLIEAPTRGASPYGMVVDAKGIPWFAESGVNQLANVDTRTMQIREFKLPDLNARPRRLTITKDDAIWYGDYSRGSIGRLEPATGAVREWRTPGGAGAQPTAITSVNDVIWYSESGVFPNTIVRFDPATEKFQTWAIPLKGAIVQNMMPNRNGDIVMAYSRLNRIAVVHLK